MFNRRFLRIKVFQALYAFSQDEKANRSTYEKNLLKSLNKTYDLYIFLLAFPVEFKYYLLNEFDVQTLKHFPDESIIAPIRTLLKNKAIVQIDRSELLKEKLKDLSEQWNGAADLFKSILTQLKENSLYLDYIRSAEHTFAEDRKFLSEVFEIIIADSESFTQYIEEHFINWEDDQVIVTLAILKSIHAVKENGGNGFIGKFDMKEEEDLDFMKKLFQYTINENDDILKLIADKTKNWEAERIAIVDMMLMKMALCEILMFPQIPVKVSINEYLELAKIYSTPNSHSFINGVLDKIQIDLKAENKINKTGRGLVE